MRREFFTVAEAEGEARAFRITCTEQRQRIALERIAMRFGCRNWNALQTTLSDLRRRNTGVGGRVTARRTFRRRGVMIHNYEIEERVGPCASRDDD